MSIGFMKKTWFVLPGYCVGLGCLVLITYRTLLAVSSPGKVILVSVNQFGEQYLDVVALAFLWVVCLVGLLCLSSVARGIWHKEQSPVTSSDGLASTGLSFHVVDSTHFVSSHPVVEEVHDGYFSALEPSVSGNDCYRSVSVSVVIQQEEIRE